MTSMSKVGKCPECNGKGKFVDAYADEYYGYDETCMFCDGNGETEIMTITKTELSMHLDDFSEYMDFLRFITNTDNSTPDAIDSAYHEILRRARKRLGLDSTEIDPNDDIPF